MDFFTKLGSKISTGANKAANKATDIAKTTKLNMQISTLEGEKKGKFTEIGAAFYRKKGVLSEEDYGPIFSRISEIEGEIAQMRGEIASLKVAEVRCASCGSLFEEGLKFCTACGAEVVSENATENVVVAGKVCSGCGSTEGEETKFCSKCGQKF